MSEEEYMKVKKELESLNIESITSIPYMRESKPYEVKEEKEEVKEEVKEEIKEEEAEEKIEEKVEEEKKEEKRRRRRRKEKEIKEEVKEEEEERPEIKPRFEEDMLEGVVTEDDLVEKAIEFVIDELSEMGVKEAILRRIAKVLRMDLSRQWIVSPTHFAWIIKQYLPRLPDIELGSIANTLHAKFGQEYIRMKQSSIAMGYYGYGFQHPGIPYLYGTFTNPHSNPAPPFMYPGYTGYTNPVSPTMQTPIHTQMPPMHVPQERRKTYTVVIDGQTVTTDDYKEYLALKEWLEERTAKEEERLRRQQEHEMRMKKLEEELRQMSGAKAEIRTSTEDALVKSLQTQIATLMNTVNELRKELDEERKKKEQEKIRELEEKAKRLDEIIRNPFDLVSYWEETLRRMGYSKTGKSAYDLIDNLRQDFQRTIDTILMRLPAPQYDRGVYGKREREERLKKAEQIIEKGLKQAGIEREILELSREVYGKESSG